MEVEMVALNEDIWKEIKASVDSLKNIRNVTHLTLNYSVDSISATIKLNYISSTIYKDQSVRMATRITKVLEGDQADELVIKLGKRFGFPCEQLKDLDIQLIPNELPLLHVSLYPLSLGIPKLDDKRSNTLTID